MITSATADALDALALTIFDPHIVPNPNPVLGDKYGSPSGLAAADANMDAQLASLIAEPMLTIDGRKLANAFRYTLNVTNALQLRPKHWYIQLQELDNYAPATVAMELHPSPGSISRGVSSFGYSIGLATCACICRAWAAIIRMWLAGEYPLAVKQPAP